MNEGNLILAKAKSALGGGALHPDEQHAIIDALSNIVDKAPNDDRKDAALAHLENLRSQIGQSGAGAVGDSNNPQEAAMADKAQGGGLKPDEVMVKAQEGEFVLSKDETAVLQQFGILDGLKAMAQALVQAKQDEEGEGEEPPGAEDEGAEPPDESGGEGPGESPDEESGEPSESEGGEGEGGESGPSLSMPSMDEGDDQGGGGEGAGAPAAAPKTMHKGGYVTMHNGGMVKGSKAPSPMKAGHGGKPRMPSPTGVPTLGKEIGGSEGAALQGRIGAGGLHKTDPSIASASMPSQAGAGMSGNGGSSMNMPKI